MSGALHRYPPTRSGDARLRPLTDDELAALQPGDTITIRRTAGRWADVEITHVRNGVAYDDANPPQPYAVPVADVLLDGRPLVFGAADCWTFTIGETGTDSAGDVPAVHPSTNEVTMSSERGSHGGQNRGKGQQKLHTIEHPTLGTKEVTQEEWRTGTLRSEGWTRRDDAADDAGETDTGADTGTTGTTDTGTQEPAP